MFVCVCVCACVYMRVFFSVFTERDSSSGRSDCLNRTSHFNFWKHKLKSLFLSFSLSTLSFFHFLTFEIQFSPSYSHKYTLHLHIHLYLHSHPHIQSHALTLSPTQGVKTKWIDRLFQNKDLFYAFLQKFVFHTSRLLMWEANEVRIYIFILTYMHSTLIHSLTH